MSSSSSRATNMTLNYLSDAEIAMLSFVNIIFGMMGSLGNVFVCFCFATCPQIRHAMSVFILSLAWSDLLVSLVAQPMYVVSLLKGFKEQTQSGNVFEDIRKCLTWVSLLASAGNLLGVTVHRYMVITKPLVYGNKPGSKACTWFFIILIWLVAICLGTSTAFSNKAKIIGQLYVFVALVCFILPIYCRVLCIAKKQQRHILATILLKGHNAADTNSLNAARLRRIHPKSERTALKTVGVISIGFFLGWLPLLIFPFIYRSFPQHRKLLYFVFQWVNTFALSSSAFNPIVYSWTDRRFRQSLRMIYKKWAVKRLIFNEMKTTV